MRTLFVGNKETMNWDKAKASASAFAKAGARAVVVVAARSTFGLSTAAADISSDSSSVERLFSQVKTRFGCTDVLVKNRRIMGDVRPMSAVSSATWWRDFVCPRSGISGQS